MAWITLKSLSTGKIISLPESVYNSYHKYHDIYTVVQENPTEANKKSIKPKEEIENVEEIQLNSENEVNSSGKNKKKTGV